MKKLAELILDFLISRMSEDQEAAFKEYVRSRYAEVRAQIPEFDPEAVQDTLTEIQIQWVNEILAEINQAP